jgi:hypothetical protein
MNGFAANRRDFDRLAEIHDDLAGTGPGRKHGVEVINKAGVVFVAACWESFIEDLAKEASDFLIDHVSAPEEVPGPGAGLRMRRPQDGEGREGRLATCGRGMEG